MYNSMGIILNAKCYVFRILMDWEMGDRKRHKAAPKKNFFLKKNKSERDETTKMDQFLSTK